MASIRCQGIDNLIKKIEKIAEVPELLKDELVLEQAETILKAQKKDAHSFSDEAYSHLSILDERKGKGYCFIDVGINADNWEKCRGLWFQNWDGERSSGKDVMWMQRSFKAIEKILKNDIVSRLTKEMDL